MQARSEELLVDIGGKFGRLFVRVWEPATAKGTVFCIHGFTGNGSDFDFLAPFLARAGYRVVCPDMFGRGRSSYFGNGADYTLDTYLKSFQALMRLTAGTDYSFLGTSWGAILVLLFVYMAKLRPRKVILNDIPARSGGDADAIRAEISTDADARFPTRDAAVAYIRKTRAFLGNVPESELGRYVDNKIIEDSGQYRLAYDPATTASFAALSGRSYDLFQILVKIAAPFLLVYGRASKFYDPAAMAELQRIRPDVWCVADIDAGHPPSLMTLAQALLVLGFLASV
ncbi:MAG: alpha/beta hydrolase [Bauldia sp.]